jgi:hypothetical protein
MCEYDPLLTAIVNRVYYYISTPVKRGKEKAASTEHSSVAGTRPTIRRQLGTRRERDPRVTNSHSPQTVYNLFVSDSVLVVNNQHQPHPFNQVSLHFDYLAAPDDEFSG